VMTEEKFIFHVDANSAYLSWEAVYRMQHGDPLDLRQVPSAIGGDPIKRSGIILAASKPAKKLGIRTGEVLNEAFKKCPHLIIAKPNYHMYMQCSRAMVEILQKYSPRVQKFSVDECFVDMCNFSLSRDQAVATAYKIKDEIHKTLGFTVNIGVGTNKITAKMASELEKPNRVHTLFPEEIEKKLWPLAVEELFGVGRGIGPKLRRLGIETIGQLAQAPMDLLTYQLKSYAHLIQSYAKGQEESEVRTHAGYEKIKSIGNSTTIKFDVSEAKDAYMVLLSLTEMVGLRLREEKFVTKVITVSIRYASLDRYSHQRKIFHYTDNTMEIFKVVQILFDELWTGEPIRHLGVRLSCFLPNDSYQYSLFDDDHLEKRRSLDRVVDELRFKYGKGAIQRASFLHSGFKSITGGVTDEEYTGMMSVL